MLKVRIPHFEELDFRQELLSDPLTMQYNHSWGGVIAFPVNSWDNWYQRWIDDNDCNCFYAYLFSEELDRYVGAIAYHYDLRCGEYQADVLIKHEFRKRGFGREGLRLLCEQFVADGHKRLCDVIAIDNPGIAIFLQAGFVEQKRDDKTITISKDF